jgi:hypothetical protein
MMSEVFGIPVAEIIDVLNEREPSAMVTICVYDNNECRVMSSSNIPGTTECLRRGLEKLAEVTGAASGRN